MQLFTHCLSCRHEGELPEKGMMMMMMMMLLLLFIRILPFRNKSHVQKYFVLHDQRSTTLKPLNCATKPEIIGFRATVCISGRVQQDNTNLGLRDQSCCRVMALLSS